MSHTLPHFRGKTVPHTTLDLAPDGNSAPDELIYFVAPNTADYVVSTVNPGTSTEPITRSAPMTCCSMASTVE